VTISSPSLRAALSLSAADRRWIDFLTQTINETWDEAHPERPKTHGYLGSEEFIRLQFEEYLLALLSSMKYHEELSQSRSTTSVHGPPKSPGIIPSATDIEGDPALEFNPDFLERWRATSNYALFSRLTSDALLFSVVEPRHPCSGGLGLDDIQRRLAQQVADMHLDEKMREGREALGKHLATGQKKVSAAFTNFWTELDAMRESQKKKKDEKPSPPLLEKDKDIKSPQTSPRPSLSSIRSTSTASWSLAARKPPAVDLTQVHATAAAAGQRASAYFSSWGSWANDRRKEWQEKKTTNSSQTSPMPSPGITLSEPTDTPASAPPTGLALSRSGSRRKRWSNIMRGRDSHDSAHTVPMLDESSRHEPQSEPQSTFTDQAAAPQVTQSAPLASISISPPPSIDDPGSGDSVPTPTLLPSDRLQTTTLSPEPAISPLVLDESGDMFTSIDLDSKPSPEATESKRGA
jgi:hypothetical protein